MEICFYFVGIWRIAWMHKQIIFPYAWLSLFFYILYISSVPFFFLLVFAVSACAVSQQQWTHPHTFSLLKIGLASSLLAVKGTHKRCPLFFHLLDPPPSANNSFTCSWCCTRSVHCSEPAFYFRQERRRVGGRWMDETEWANNASDERRRRRRKWWEEGEEMM